MHQHPAALLAQRTRPDIRQPRRRLSHHHDFTRDIQLRHRIPERRPRSQCIQSFLIRSHRNTRHRPLLTHLVSVVEMIIPLMIDGDPLIPARRVQDDGFPQTHLDLIRLDLPMRQHRSHDQSRKNPLPHPDKQRDSANDPVVVGIGVQHHKPRHIQQRQNRDLHPPLVRQRFHHFRRQLERLRQPQPRRRPPLTEYTRGRRITERPHQNRISRRPQGRGKHLIQLGIKGLFSKNKVPTHDLGTDGAVLTQPFHQLPMHRTQKRPLPLTCQGFLVNGEQHHVARRRHHRPLFAQLQAETFRKPLQPLERPQPRRHIKNPADHQRYDQSGTPRGRNFT